jgi:hypothetical protein
VTRRTPQFDNASQMLAAVLDVLEASQQLGLDVVLSIGYQIQMGVEWNTQNRDELRRDPDGGFMNHWISGETASPYSEKYRRDILEYYQWVDANVIRRYPNVVALNLADEPMGSDFSAHALSAFRVRYGTRFEDAPAHDRGEFLAGVIPDYASWSATRWRELSPDLPTMMTFHVQRDAPFLPDVERIFAQTPETFIFSADTHLDDGPMNRPVTPRNVNLLHGMVRTFGWLSKVYGKRLMLWTSANAWGLKPTGGVGEALQNLDLVHDGAKGAGGTIGMLLAWGWNIQGQGVYDDQGNFPRDKEPFIGLLSDALAQKRDQLSIPSGGAPDSVVYVPKSVLYPAFGERRITHLADGVVDLSGVDFTNENTVYLTDGPALEAARQAGIPIVPL